MIPLKMRGFIVILPLLLTLLAKTAQAGLSCVKVSDGPATEMHFCLMSLLLVYGI